ncbi:hypothetical protein [Paludisphaera soli]|uniref:hypothetical protein n=1 Tax=Paludisphaera soli TaxID=2712865 RepID=UPI0013ED2428|nr:hypothetical protein [Paludisphaera soli]
MPPPPSDWKSDPRMVPRAILGLIACGLIWGTLCGLIEWTAFPRRVPTGDTLAVHVSWRIFSATLATVISASIVAVFIRPLTPERAMALLPTQIAVVGRDFSRASFPGELLFFAVAMGLFFGVLLRIVLNLGPRAGDPAEIRRYRSR